MCNVRRASQMLGVVCEMSALLSEASKIMGGGLHWEVLIFFSRGLHFSQGNFSFFYNSNQQSQPCHTPPMWTTCHCQCLWREPGVSLVYGVSVHGHSRLDKRKNCALIRAKPPWTLTCQCSWHHHRPGSRLVHARDILTCQCLWHHHSQVG